MGIVKNKIFAIVPNTFSWEIKLIFHSDIHRSVVHGWRLKINKTTNIQSVRFWRDLNVSFTQDMGFEFSGFNTEAWSHALI